MRSLFLLLSVALVACSGGSDDPGTDTPMGDDDDDDVVYTGCLADGIAVMAGTGPDSVIELSDNDPVTMVHGPQGGWHIDVSGTVSNTEQLVLVEALFTDADGNVVAGDQAGARKALIGWNAESCTGDFVGERIFVDDFVSSSPTQDDICGLEGLALDLTLTVTAIEAEPPAVVEVTIPVVAALDPLDIGECE